MNDWKKYKGAFTLIELLVVIAIIGILTSIVLTNLTSHRSKARDADRIADMGHLQLALEMYYDKCKQYPRPSGGGVLGAVNISASNCATGVTAVMSDYIARIPTPPSLASYYDYAVNDSTKPTDYILHVLLENSSEVQRDSYQGSAYGSLTCFDGSNKHYCLSPK